MHILPRWWGAWHHWLMVRQSWGGGRQNFRVFYFIRLDWRDRSRFPLRLFSLDYLRLHWTPDSFSWKKYSCAGKLFVGQMYLHLWNGGKNLWNKPFSLCFFFWSLLPSNWVTTIVLFFTFSLILLHRRAFWEMLSNTVTMGKTPFSVGPSYLQRNKI